jgi:hypothetical protein
MSEPEEDVEEQEDVTYRDQLIAVAMHAVIVNGWGDLSPADYHISIAEAAVNIADATLALSYYEEQEEEDE